MNNKKLDQSLDTIMTDRKANSNRRRSARAANKKNKAAPVGGVHKPTKPAKQGKPAALPNKSNKPVEGKVMISGLPKDVNENDLKEYIQSQVGPTKSVMLNYSAGGHSRGVAIVTFVKPGDANKALEKLGSISIDNNRLRVDIIVDAAHAPAPEPAKSFADRVSKPKSDNQKPKPATAAKEGEDKKKAGRGRGRPARGRGGRNTNTRNKPKTAEELDQEMTDYWNGTGADAMATNGGAVQPTAATNGDAGMEDEIM